MLIDTPNDGATCYNNSSRLRKRPPSFPASFDIDERKMITNKRRKKAECFFDDIVTMDCNFSTDLDLPEVCVPHSDNDGAFDWMGNILNDRYVETSSTEGNDKNNTDSYCIDSFSSLDECDPYDEEIISLLAVQDNDSNSEENVFKTIQESFISDRLLGQHFFSSTSSLPNADYSKNSTLKRSLSFNTRRGRSSRIGIRQGLAKLVKANTRSAKTRHILLNCKLSSYKTNSQ